VNIRVGIVGAGANTRQRHIPGLRAIVVVVVVVLVCIHLGWRFYDPTVPWSRAEEEMPLLVGKTFPKQAQIFEQRSEPFVPERIPFLIRLHPKYWKAPRFATGLPESSRCLLITLPQGRLHFSVHFFRGRTVAFTILCPPQLKEAASRLRTQTQTAFPGLSVNIMVSEQNAISLTTPENEINGDSARNTHTSHSKE
jgi:hypothetical protein